MFNVFRKDSSGTVRHFWGSELVYAPEEPGQNHRAGDLVDPLWGLLDMTPEGRGTFFPDLSYAARGDTASVFTFTGEEPNELERVGRDKLLTEEA